MSNPRGHAWRKLRAQVLADATHCALCGLPLIPDAPPRSRWASEVDHMWPIGNGGPVLPPIDMLRPVHKGCNVRHGNRTVPRRRVGGGEGGGTPRRPQGQETPSRRW